MPSINRNMASIMMNPMSDNDDEIYLKKEGIDRTVGYLISGILILLFFLLTVVGMGRIQNMSDATATSNRFSTPEVKTSEIGDVEPASVKD